MVLPTMTLQIESQIKNNTRQRRIKTYPDEYIYKILKVCASSYKGLVSMMTLQNKLETDYTLIKSHLPNMEQRGLIRPATTEEKIVLAKHRIVTVRGNVDRMARKYAEVYLKKLIAITDKGVWLLSKMEELYELLPLVPSR